MRSTDKPRTDLRATALVSCTDDEVQALQKAKLVEASGEEGEEGSA